MGIVDAKKVTAGQAGDSCAAMPACLCRMHGAKVNWPQTLTPAADSGHVRVFGYVFKHLDGPTSDQISEASPWFVCGLDRMDAPRCQEKILVLGPAMTCPQNARM